MGWALREARFAGLEMDIRVWRNALRYWTKAALYDGGFGLSGDRYGGISLGSTAGFTALGASALIGTLDMSAGMRASNCNTYLANREQLRTIDSALNWLDENFQENLAKIGEDVEDPYVESTGLQRLAEVSGIAVLNNQNHFTEAARKLLEHYDASTGLFGVRGAQGEWAESPSVRRTADALITLGAGAAPVILQRMIVGDDEVGRGQMRGDAAHIVRYLSRERGRPFQWRWAAQDSDVRFLAEVPILMLSVVGRFEWPEEQWTKLREYALAGGTLLIDVGDGQEGLREEVQAQLRRTFPEYTLRELPADSPVYSAEKKIEDRPTVLAMSNGFREFLLAPQESWSCQWHLYDVQSRRASFGFLNNLLTYATDGSPPRNWLTRSTYAVATVPSHRMTAAHVQHGGEVPAYPDLIESMDRLMQENFRLQIEPVDDAGTARLLWISVAGAAPLADRTRSALTAALEGDRFVLIDVISGDERWDERFRDGLAAIDGLTLRPLRRTHAVYTGEIPGTQGFDCVQVNLRKAMQTRWSTAGRCDLYELRWKGEFAGVYSSYDLSSGIGYHFFPKCRGVMPKHARELAMNAFLAAYARAETQSVVAAP